jgi:type I restriction enzyme S subunit
MSCVSFIDKLLCGVTVKWIQVGELISPQRGRRLVKSQLEETGTYAVYQNSLKPLGYYHDSNVPAGITFVIVAGAAGEIGFNDVAFWAADDVYFFPAGNVVNQKYLYHFLLAKKHEISSQVRRASVPRLSIAAIEKLPIPIPCPENPEKSLEIQAEIVRILDAFTELTHELTAELTAELTTRKKQYNYYRDQLLNFEGGDVEWKALGELADNLDSMRRPITSSLRNPGDIPYYGASGVVDHVKDYIFDGDFLLVSEDGANLLARSTPIAFSVSGKSWVNNHAHVLKFETYAERRYDE